MSRFLLGKFLESEDTKSLFFNFSWLFCLKIVGYVFPFITIPYLARVLGSEGIGKIAFAASVNVWIMTICDWGFSYTATRNVARCKADINQVSKIYSVVMSCRMLLMIGCFIIMSLLVMSVHSLRCESVLFFFTFLSIPGHILFPEWFFQAMEKMKYVTIFNVVVKLFFTIAVFVFINQNEDYVLQPLFLSAGFLMVGFITHFYIKKYWGINFCWVPLSVAFHEIKNNLDVFLSVFMHNLYDSFSRIMLGYYCGYKQSGLYDAGNKFYDVSMQFFKLLSTAFFPLLSRKINIHKYYTIFSLGIAIILSLFLWISAPMLIQSFYTEEFSDAIVVLRILIVSLPFAVMVNIYGTNYLLIVGEERKLRKIITKLSLIGFVLSFPLIAYFQAFGVAILLLIVRVIMTIVLLIASKKHSSVAVSNN